MKKDAYYFPHFCNARNDSKIVKIRRVLGLEGYAIYFMLLEILREQTEFKYPISGVEDLAYEWHTSKEKILNVICDYELFKIDTETNFFSTKLVLYLQPYLEKSARASVAAKKRWDSVYLQLSCEKNNANAMQMHNESNANAMQVKESKLKESKIKNNIDISIKFYENEISQNANGKLINEYTTFFNFINGENKIKERLDSILKLPKQVSYIQFEKLLETSKIEKKKLGDILPKMTNNPKHLKGKTSLYLTIDTWLKNSYTV